MAKFYGKVGYSKTEEKARGVYVEVVTERMYYGDVTRNTRRLEGAETLNDNLLISNTISIVADAYAFENYFAIKYVVWGGARWKVQTVDVQPPRLILYLGEVYNGPLPA